MNLGLKGKVAIVTGGAQGLGRGIALGLVAEGAHVAVVDIKEEEVKRVVAEIRQSGGKAIAIKTDATKTDQVKAMVDTVLHEFGRIDILMNNAGIVGPQCPWVDLDEKAFDFVTDVNFKGVYLCAKAVLPYMIAQKSGKIVNTASLASKTGEEFNGIYSATKAAVHSITQSLAREVAPSNITVNDVCPGAMPTDLMEKVYRERGKYFRLTEEQFRKRVRDAFLLPSAMTVEDVVNVFLFLVSDKANMMTGQSINICGATELH